MWIDFKRKRKSDLIEQNPIYKKYEPIIEMDDEDWWNYNCLCNELHPATEEGYIKRDEWLAERIFFYKIGDGITPYNDLEYKGTIPGAMFLDFKGTEVFDPNV